MSAFLGHIHYWLFNKIRMVNEREEMLFAHANSMCSTTAEEIREQVHQTFGEPLPDRDLAELIDHTNIHGWLQRQINLAETREAAMIMSMQDMCGGMGDDVAATVFAEHGELCGKRARETGQYALATAEGIYKALNDYFLNGMPCDQGNMVVETNQDLVAWSAEVCLKEPNWRRAEADPSLMRSLYQKWLAGFVTAANPSFTYSSPSQNGCVRYEIRKK